MTVEESPGGRPPEQSAVLTTAQCWELLAQEVVGRLGVVAQGYPLIFPVNFGLDDQVVVIQTGPGLKLTSADHANVSFEVDRLDRHTGRGWSVLLRGLAEEVTEEHSTATRGRTTAAGTQPWEAGPHEHQLRVIPHGISGRSVGPAEQSPFGEAAGYP